MIGEEGPPTVAIVGWKNSGKTTLLVAVAAELRRRGLRIASVKHGHPHFELDHPGKDSWRHFHEGEVEAVLIAAENRIAMVMRTEGEPDPRALIDHLFAGRGYDLILVEGYKVGPFPRVEIFRDGAEPVPICAAHPNGTWLAILSDADVGELPVPRIPLGRDEPHAAHVRTLADLLVRHLHTRGAA